MTLLARARRWGGSLLLAVAAVSCSSSEPKSPAPAIPTGGDTASLKTLVGRWEGTYTNVGNGRTGTIVLEFFSGGKEAHGDILMIPPGSMQEKPSPAEDLRSMPQVLEINFIDAGAGGQVSGTVGPYEDPDTHCRARTEFAGVVKVNVIEGTFKTECVPGESPGGAPTTGNWAVARK
jgi:hypothetical protein